MRSTALAALLNATLLLPVAAAAAPPPYAESGQATRAVAEPCFDA